MLSKGQTDSVATIIGYLVVYRSCYSHMVPMCSDGVTQQDEMFHLVP